MALAVRGFVQFTQATQELWSMKFARQAISDMEAELTAPACSHCCLCGRDLEGRLQGVLCDIDQAFEACSADRVLADWRLLESVGTSRYQEEHPEAGAG